MAETKNAPSLREWVLVPIFPTEAMMDAGASECRRNAGVIDPVVHIWDAMVAAAPPAPTTHAKAIATARAEGVREGLEKAAETVAPKWPRPCDCERCDCGNSGDTAAVAGWDADNAAAQLIRALIPAPPTLSPGGRADG